MEDSKDNKEEIFSKRIRAGKKRTYFIDVRSTRKNDYYVTLTESKRKHPESKEFIKHKIFLYKEDFNKFVEGLNEAIDYVKNDLLPDYDFEKFDKDEKSQTITRDNFEEGQNTEKSFGDEEDEDLNTSSTPSDFEVSFSSGDEEDEDKDSEENT